MATYYVANTAGGGNDANPGTIGSPFRNWEKLATVMVAGDTAYIRGGTYVPTTATSLYIHCYWVNLIGTAALPIVIQNYPGEVPVYDFTGFVTTNAGGNSWCVYLDSCQFLTVKGLRITGFDQIADGSGVCRGMAIDISPNCTIENCEIDHMGGDGFVVGNDSHNLVFKNCDSHHHADPFSPGAEYGGANGFTKTGGVTATNVRFEGCRAWWCSDDGFDEFLTDGLSTYKSCWSFWHGYIPGTFTDAGTFANGTGFKLGPTLTSPLAQVTRVLHNCLSFENKDAGFGQNAALTRIQMYNCTAYKNGGNGFWFAWYPEYAQDFRNNIAWDNTGGEIDEAGGNIGGSNNTWDGGVTVSNADFQSISSTGMDGARGSDGSLPVLTFMKLVTGSDLVNAGISVGLPYNGTAPDLGWYERYPMLKKLSETDLGFLNVPNSGDTHPFNSGDQVGFTVQAGDTLPVGTYYWRVRVKDNPGTNEYSAWSSTRSFTVSSGIAADVTETVTATDTESNTKVTGATAAETGTATETESNTLVTAAVAAETGTATETESGALVTASAITETGTATDVINSSFLFVAAAAETATATDVEDTTMAKAAANTEAATGTDTGAVLLTTLAAVTEAGSATDTDTATHQKLATLTESGSATDTDVAVLSIAAGITETATALDTTANSLTTLAAINEAGTAIDAVIAAGDDGVIETAAANDVTAVSVITGAIVSEVATATDVDAAARVTISAISETATASESISALMVTGGEIMEPVTAIENISAALAMQAIMAEAALAIEQQDATDGRINQILEAASATETLACSVITRARVIETATAADICYRPAFPETIYKKSTISGTVVRRSRITALKEQDSTITITRDKRSII